MREKKAVDLIFIAEGKAHLEKNGTYVGEMAKGEFFGEASLIQRGFEPFTVISDTPMILLSVHKMFVDHVLKRIPDRPETLKRPAIYATQPNGGLITDSERVFAKERI